MQEDINILKQAIINEIQSFEFYRMAGVSSKSEETKKAFEQLSNDEFIHVEWLQKLLNLLLKNSEEAFNVAFADNPPSPGIFPREQLQQNSSLTLAVFEIAIQMEKASIEFYQDALAKTQIPSAKQLYTLLTAWEDNHLKQFEAHYDSLKEDWWNEQNFQPY